MPEGMMNGGHDLGGMHGFGPILAEPEAREPVFHADWEKRVFGMVRALGALGQWNGDMSRHARERQHPVDYLRHSYYENWLAGLERLLLETKLVSADELASGKAAGLADGAIRNRLLRPEEAHKALEGSPAAMPLALLPRFVAGARVRALNRHPAGHTREPRYVRGRVGVIHEHHGAHLFPDLSARGMRVPRHLYSVRFEGRELWGDDAAAKSAVYVDLWEDYLESA
jgi:nitrile hydratase beta subunit